MKKNITNYKALLISLASKGDCTAFYSLVVPHLQSSYIKSINEGVDHKEASASLCTKGVDLYKKFIGVQTDDFNQWLNTDGELEEVETDFLQSNKVQVGSFLSELHLELQRAHSLQHIKSNSKIIAFFKNTTGKIALASFSLLILLSISVFFLSQYSIKIQISSSEKKGLSFTFSSAQDTGSPVKIDSTAAIKDTAKSDTVPKVGINSDTIVKKQRTLTQTRRAVSSNTDYQPKNSVSTTPQSTVNKEQPVPSQVKSSEPSVLSSTNNTHENIGNPITPPKPASSVVDSSFGKEN